MKLARRITPAVLLVAAAVLTGCSSPSEADTAADTGCVDVGLPNATAEELVDVLRPQPAGEPDDAYRQLAAQFEESRDARIAQVQSGAVFTAIPEGGDAAFVKAVCGQSRWDATTTPDGTEVPSQRSQRAAIVAAGHSFCETYEHLRPSAVSTDAWSDWNGYVEMMTRGDDSAEAKQLYSSALENLCPQFGA
ncbi:hypothetical protein ACFWPA_07845 [Rhodococcus sp. NPDC058505]|uniref:hypothetical protein n=1 Tax=unclassified Rhodococcus (in: high G+C Gram-positive bacteria) TaxID=192944 RepID=UPI003666BA5C